MTADQYASRTIDSVTIGEVVQELLIPITRTMIVATALASRDYEDVHHDPDRARDKGSADIFMNILTSNGLVERYVRGWSGPAARLTALKIRLGAPNYPGDTMRLSANVSAVDLGTGRVLLDVTGSNSLGTHLAGTAELQLGPVPRV
jgi:acyl dehydratase